MDPNPLDDWTRAARAVSEERRETRTNLYRRTGVVASASVDGECTVQLGAVGAAVPAAILGGGSLAVGDVVVVDVWQGEVLVLGQVGGHTETVEEERRERSSNVPVATGGTPSPLVYNVVAWGGSTLWTVVGATVTWNAALLFDVRCGVAWDSNANGRRRVAITHNGVDIGRDQRRAVTPGGTDQQAFTRINAAVNDTTTVTVFQDSGVSLNVLGNPVTFLEIRTVGRL